MWKFRKKFKNSLRKSKYISEPPSILRDYFRKYRREVHHTFGFFKEIRKHKKC